MHVQQLVQDNAHRRGLRLLTLTIFLLLAAPRLRVMVGAAPLYIIDILALLTAYHAARIDYPWRSSLRPLVIFILFAAVLSEWIAAGRMGTLAEPVYLIGRTLLAGSLFFSVPKLIQTDRDLEPILKAAVLGALITSVLMIMTSLPETRSLVTEHVFSRTYLEPADAALRYDLFLLEADRGRSLVGVSILSAAFLNSIWALLFLLRARPTLGAKWTLLLNLCAFLIPIGVIMSYSRGALIGLLLVGLTVLFVNTSTVRRPFVLGIGLVLVVITWVGWDSTYFFFERIEYSTELALEDPYNNVSVTERLYAYSEPWEHLANNPGFFFLGEGFARRVVGGNELTAGSDAATHAVFASAYYGYGLLAALAYVLLMLAALVITWRYVRRAADPVARGYSGALLAGLMGMSSWFMLGHAGVSEPRGAMLIFFMFGLVAAQASFVRVAEPVATELPSSPRWRSGSAVVSTFSRDDR